MSSFTPPAESAPSASARTASSDSDSPAASGMKLTRLEIAIIALALVVLAVLRWFSVYSHRWNSDEPQHLHVVWAWTVGKLQYRDVFDNHTPLFHILCAPLLHWLGERADIVQPMRQAMMPLFAAGIWCVYRLAASLYDRRTGWFAAILAALLPAFYFRMGEFRTDVMWTTVWLLTLVVALTGRMTPGRIFAAALLLGTAFSVSMKTTYLVFFLVVAGTITWLLAGRPISKSLPAYIFAFVGGVLVVPGAIVAYFASQGALKSLYHCVIEHNTMPGESLGGGMLHRLFNHSTLWLIPAWICTAAILPGVRQEPARGYRRLFLFLIAALFYPLLRIFWPVVTAQDYLPWLPLLPIFAVPGCAWVRDWLQKKSSDKVSWLLVLCPIAAVLFVWLATPNDSPADAAVPKRLAYLAVLLPIYLIAGFVWLRERRQSPLAGKVAWLLLPSLLLAGEIVYIVTNESIFARPEQRRIGHLAQLLRLIDPGEYVLDTKGETIFRPRPTYLVLETLTIKQIQLGRIQDDIVPRLIDTRTALVHSSSRMTPQAQEFIDKNYVHVDGGRVLGKRLATPKNMVVHFDIIVPEHYGFVTPYGAASGTLDGQPIDGPRWLEPGKHEIVSSDAAGQIVLVWQRALERGFSPYIDSDAKAAD